ncbi:MAG: hypothetical protein Ta2E_12240 [Mycoplasmoidaceae bacterium]|nr:MAG: hypothetical protein Ta2E_12240 [Mycoplasmoidaceae bacterium]
MEFKTRAQDKMVRRKVGLSEDVYDDDNEDCIMNDFEEEKEIDEEELRIQKQKEVWIMTREEIKMQNALTIRRKKIKKRKIMGIYKMSVIKKLSKSSIYWKMREWKISFKSQLFDHYIFWSKAWYLHSHNNYNNRYIPLKHRIEHKLYSSNHQRTTNNFLCKLPLFLIFNPWLV